MDASGVTTSGNINLEKSGAKERMGLTALILIAIALPFFISDYHTFQLTQVLVYALAIFGLNLLSGFNGQISIGHGAFYAIGAYTAGILMQHFELPYWATPIPAGLICFVFGVLVGLPALRLEGHYLALATFALALVVPQLLKYKGLEDWTGGSEGLVLDKPAAPAGLPLTDDQWLYLLTLAVTLVMIWAGWNLLRGRIGRSMTAIRDHSLAAGVMGINKPLVKTVTFGISALYTGVAGALAAITVQFVAPDSFTIFLSISLIVGVAVGGLASISGAFYGALFLVFVPNYAAQISKAAPWAIYGILLIGFMYLMPTGIAGGVARIGAFWRLRSQTKK